MTEDAEDDAVAAEDPGAGPLDAAAEPRWEPPSAVAASMGQEPHVAATPVHEPAPEPTADLRDDAVLPPDDSRTLASLHRVGQIGTLVLNRLVLAGMRTVGDVRLLGDEGPSKLRGVGPSGVAELRAARVLGVPPSAMPAEQTHDADEHPSATGGQRHSEDSRFLLGSARVPAHAVVTRPMPVHPRPDGDGPARPQDCQTLECLQAELETRVSEGLRDILSDRETLTLEALAAARGVTRERVRQLEAKGRRQVRTAVRTCAPRIEEHWRACLTRAVASEVELFDALLDPDADLAIMHRFGHWVLRAVIEEARPLRVRGRPIPSYWTTATNAKQDFTEELRMLADSGPYPDRQLDEALDAFGISPDLGRALLLHHPSAPLAFDDRVGAWVRRSARTRDACFVILERAARPASARVLARILNVEERNLAANLERDERFRRLFARRKWALTAWGDLGEGTRYRSTREAVVDVLTGAGCLSRAEVTARVLSVHPVTSWAVANQLECEIFGHHSDGTVSMAYVGGEPYQEPTPELPPDVDEDEEHGIVSLQIPITRDVLRGSGIPVPRRVTWFAGLHRVPRDHRFEDEDGCVYVLRRTPGLASISSMRSPAHRMGLSIDCRLAVTLDCRNDRVSFSAACPCHGRTSSGGRSKCEPRVERHLTGESSDTVPNAPTGSSRLVGDIER